MEKFQFLDDNASYIPGVCTWNNQYFANNATWQVGCNTCTCENSIVRCTKVWCGLGNCLSNQQSNYQETAVCNKLQVCVPLSTENCLLEPCTPWGECRSLDSNRIGLPSHSTYPSETDCWPNQAITTYSCARLLVVLERSKLPRGTTLESFCTALRTVLANHQSSRKQYEKLFLLCGLKQG